MKKSNTSAAGKVQVKHLTARVKKTESTAAAPIYNPAIHTAVQKSAANKPAARTTLHIPVPAHVRPAVQLPVTVHKTTYTRKNLPDGDFMMNYYYRRNKNGDLVPEDIESATHFERVVYDRNGGVIGSTTGELNDTVRW